MKPATKEKADPLIEREKFAISLRKSRKKLIFQERRSKLVKRLSQEISPTQISDNVEMSQKSSSSRLPFKSSKQLIDEIDLIEGLLVDTYGNADSLADLLENLAKLPVDLSKKPFRVMVSH